MTLGWRGLGYWEQKPHLIHFTLQFSLKLHMLQRKAPGEKKGSRHQIGLGDKELESLPQLPFRNIHLDAYL